MKKLTLLILLMSCVAPLFAQNVVINLDGAPGDDSAILDVQSTTSGMLVPRMTTAEKLAIAEPANGLLVFDTDLQQFAYFDGAWKVISEALQAQTLTIDGNDLSISDGNTVTLPESQSALILDADGNTIVTTNSDLDSDEVTIYLGDDTQSSYTFTSKGISYDDFYTPALALGRDAGGNITSGAANTFLGYAAGVNSSTVSYNTFVGYEAGRNIQGSSNTLVGTQAGYQLDGYGNTFLGDYTAPFMSTGDNNTFLGTSAGQGLNSGSGNVFIGYSAGASGNVNNTLYIANSSTIPLIYGEFNNDYVRVNGTLEATQGLILGNATVANDGVIRFNNGIFEGYDGSSWLTLSGGVATPSAFEEVGGVIYNSGNPGTDDFAIGSASLDVNAGEQNWTRMFWDQSLGAFRAGGTITTSWDEAQRGQWSFAVNSGTTASGASSFAANYGGEANGNNTSAFGSSTIANSFSSFALGAYNIGLSNSMTLHHAQNTVLEVGIGVFGDRENALTIFRDGLVVIGGGTSLTHDDLNPDYIFAVDGDMLCERIRVADSGNWPDFVFETEYDLPDLEEVKAFIAQNGHLPGVPSAEEVNGNGFELGEMNEVLLQKVEELTLYILDLKEQLNALQSNQANTTTYGTH